MVVERGRSVSGAPPAGAATATADRPPRGGQRHARPPRSLWLALVGWMGANLWVALTADSLPFDWPARAGRSVAEHLVDVNLGLVQVLLLIGVVALLTRNRTIPDVAARAPGRALAMRETLVLLGYGVGGLVGAYVLARAFGWHAFGWHVAGSIFGTHAHVEPAEVVTWAGYNLVVYAVLPLLYFRRRYTAEALGLRSSDRRNDLLVVAVVLVLETGFQVLAAQPQLGAGSPGSLLLGAAVTFVVSFAGAVLPAMVFIYAILVPRYLALTGSATTTVILGGLTYAGMHVGDAWAVFTDPRGAALSVAFLLFTYVGPGMVKTYLTLRTGNAWVHVWAYHAFAPHTLLDSSHIAGVFRIR